MNRRPSGDFNDDPDHQAFDEDAEDTRKSNRIALLIGLCTVVFVGVLVFSWRAYLPYLWRGGDNSVLIGIAVILLASAYSAFTDKSKSSAEFCDGGIEGFYDNHSDAGIGY